jgi:hypothetical protein
MDEKELSRILRQFLQQSYPQQPVNSLSRQLEQLSINAAQLSTIARQIENRNHTNHTSENIQSGNTNSQIIQRAYAKFPANELGRNFAIKAYTMPEKPPSCFTFSNAKIWFNLSAEEKTHEKCEEIFGINTCRKLRLQLATLRASSPICDTCGLDDAIITRRNIHVQPQWTLCGDCCMVWFCSPQCERNTHQSMCGGNFISVNSRYRIVFGCPKVPQHYIEELKLNEANIGKDHTEIHPASEIALKYFINKGVAWQTLRNSPIQTDKPNIVRIATIMLAGGLNTSVSGVSIGAILSLKGGGKWLTGILDMYTAGKLSKHKCVVCGDQPNNFIFIGWELYCSHCRPQII